MSYEEAVKAKHAFEDSFNEVLYLLSVMDRRELELAAAKLGDGLAHEDERIDRDSALLTVRIIAMLLSLRVNEVVTQHKWRRAWIRRKRKVYAQEVAKLQQTVERQAYQTERKRIEQVRRLERRNYARRYEKWVQEVAKLALWRRWFWKPQRPYMPDLTPLPQRPPSAHSLGQEIALRTDFGEILVERVYYHSYPSIEYADDVVNEDHVRQRAVALLEDKR